MISQLFNETSSLFLANKKGKKDQTKIAITENKMACKFFRRKSNLPIVPESEILVFYTMIKKMKKRHPHINPEKIVKKLYPYYSIKK